MNNKIKVNLLSLAIEEFNKIKFEYNVEDLYWSLFGLNINGFIIWDKNEIIYLYKTYFKNARI